MSNPITEILELFEKWLRIRDNRVKKQFELIDSDIQDLFTKIHSVYRKTFLDNESALRRIRSLDSNDNRLLFEKLKEEFQRTRIQEEDLRIQLRKEAGAILEHTQHRGMQRYLISIINYFLEEKSWNPSDTELDSLIDRVINESGTIVYTTPFGRIERKLKDSDSPLDVAEKIKEERNSLNERFGEVCAKYIQLKYEVTQLA